MSEVYEVVFSGPVMEGEATVRAVMHPGGQLEMVRAEDLRISEVIALANAFIDNQTEYVCEQIEAGIANESKLDS